MINKIDGKACVNDACDIRPPGDTNTITTMLNETYNADTDIDSLIGAVDVNRTLAAAVSGFARAIKDRI